MRSVAFADTSAIYYFLRMANLERPETVRGRGGAPKPTHKQTHPGRLAETAEPDAFSWAAVLQSACQLSDAE